MGSLSSLVPTPRPLPCGGSVVNVAEFRIRDLAELQAILDARDPDPWEAIREEIASGPAPQRRAELLADAWEAAERGPAQVGTEGGNAYFSTTEGAALILWMATRRHTPGMTPERAASLFLAATAGEIGRIWRSAYGISATAALERHVFAPEILAMGKAGTDRGVSWPEAVDELSRERNWTYSYIYDLTISEFSNAKRHGKERETGITLAPGQPWGDIQEIQRRWIQGECSADGS